MFKIQSTCVCGAVQWGGWHLFPEWRHSGSLQWGGLARRSRPIAVDRCRTARQVGSFVAFHNYSVAVEMFCFILYSCKLDRGICASVSLPRVLKLKELDRFSFFFDVEIVRLLFSILCLFPTDSCECPYRVGLEGCRFSQVRVFFLRKVFQKSYWFQPWEIRLRGKLRVSRRQRVLYFEYSRSISWVLKFSNLTGMYSGLN